MLNIFLPFLLLLDLGESALVERWDRRAEEWDCYVGSEGQLDPNRYYQSDPVLMSKLGDVKGYTVLDVGCGNGYISKKLAQMGAQVIAIDFSPKMLEVAKKNCSDLSIDFRLDDASVLQTIPSGSIDRIVSNYSLIEIHDLEKVIFQFYRVLKEGGEAVIVIIHPCYQKVASSSYFAEQAIKWPSSHMTEDYIVFHRPLATYWKTFTKAGFTVIDFDEPSLPQGDEVEQKLADKLTAKPLSALFVFKK